MSAQLLFRFTPHRQGSAFLLCQNADKNELRILYLPLWYARTVYLKPLLPSLLGTVSLHFYASTLVLFRVPASRRTWPNRGSDLERLRNPYCLLFSGGLGPLPTDPSFLARCQPVPRSWIFAGLASARGRRPDAISFVYSSRIDLALCQLVPRSWLVAS